MRVGKSLLLFWGWTRQRQGQRQIQGFWLRQNDGPEQTTATAKTNTEILRFAQDDGVGWVILLQW
jgi:hypothetical protein